MCLEVPDELTEPAPAVCPVCGNDMGPDYSIEASKSVYGGGPDTYVVGWGRECTDCGVKVEHVYGSHPDDLPRNDWTVECHYCKRERMLDIDAIPEEPCRHCRKLLRQALKGGEQHEDRE